MDLFEKIRFRARANRYKNKYDKAEIAFVLESLSPGQCAFDIGAHRGGYLYFLREKVTATGQVHVFEPQSKLAGYLERISAIMKWSNVFVENTAMSDTTAGGNLYVPNHKKHSKGTQLATIAPEHNPEGFQAIGHIDTDTIDDYCTRKGLRPDFLKIDVEGNELKVLKGAENTLRNNPIKLLVEIEVRHAGQEKVLETFAWMASLGYKGYLLLDSGRIPVEQFSVAEHQDTRNMKHYFNNFIFLK